MICSLLSISNDGSIHAYCKLKLQTTTNKQHNFLIAKISIVYKRVDAVPKIGAISRLQLNLGRY